MKVLFLGDIVGSPGRKVVAEKLPFLKEKYQPDLIIANGENIAHGKGITRKTYNEVINSGIDVLTMGNHCYDKPDIFAFLEEVDNIALPDNLYPRDKGVSTVVKEINGLKVGITSLCGEVFMHNVIDSPFVCMEEILDEFNDIDIHLVDLHAEATSEKIAFAYNFKSRIAAVVGTHTHVQTADERIIEGTAAITDLGMCGVYHSILGRDIDEILSRFVNKEKTKYKMAAGDSLVCGCVVTIDDTTKQAINIERFKIDPKSL